MKSYFSREELLMGREVADPITQEMSDNLDKLIEAMDKIRDEYGKPLKVSSGYRPASINSGVGGAKKSAHMMCQAVDIIDKDGEFAEWVMNNLDFVKECGILGIEDTRYTITLDSNGNRAGGWTHLDVRGVKSGTLVFIPYAGPIKLKVV
jgi:hypothetical protein